jgi:hypothetical protein
MDEATLILFERLVAAQERIADADEKRNDLLEADRVERLTLAQASEQRQARQEARQQEIFEGMKAAEGTAEAWARAREFEKAKRGRG